MATSSIFANFNIKDQKTARRFVAALEASEKDCQKSQPVPIRSLITDHNEIRKFMAKRKKTR